MSTKIKQLRHLALASLLLLPACETIENTYDTITYNTQNLISTEQDIINYQKCPTVTVAEDLSMLHQFSPAELQTDNNLQSKTTLTITKDTCSYNNKAVTIDLTLQFNGMLGPKGRINTNDAPLHSHPFFVAITNSNGSILAKQIFAATLTYPQGQNTATYTESLRQIIPIKNRDSAKKYTIITGFQLSDEALTYNREHLKQQRTDEKFDEKTTETPNLPVPLTK